MKTMAIHERFAIFILSHGRADKQTTLEMILKKGYSGDWFIVCDDEDDQLRDYQTKYGEKKILVFSKKDVMQRIDTVDNFKRRSTVLYARTAAYEFAEKMGYEYFVQTDDDHTNLIFRYLEDGSLKSKNVEDIDSVLNSLIEFYSKTNIQIMAFGADYDYFGGAQSNRFMAGLSDSCPSCWFFCSVARGHHFISSFAEDLVYASYADRTGDVYKSVVNIQLVYPKAGSGDGGMSESYKEMGNSHVYEGKMRAIIVNPAGKQIAQVVDKFQFRSEKESARPKILAEEVKK